jgi:solute carrier family 15 (peptide/histidine transporter), member 3/4
MTTLKLMNQLFTHHSHQSFVLFTLSAALPFLRPLPCAPPGACQHATPRQLAVLYAAVCLLAIGTGGTRFNVATMGADQFGSARDQDTFFNWYFVCLYASFMIGDTAIVYLQDGVSWAIGFGVCLATSAASLGLLLLGMRYFQMPAPMDSPYTALARVAVAAMRKARVNVRAPGQVQYYVGEGVVVTDLDSDGAPSRRLRQVIFRTFVLHYCCMQSLHY